MYSFASDYLEGACPEVLEALSKTNDVQTPGYGMDVFCEQAAEQIRKAIGIKDKLDIHFITGGTPCNVLAMCLLKPYEAVISVSSAHINVHETGAVEASGHKIIAVEGNDGKLSAADIDRVCQEHTDEHMVKPGMVFISNTSEYGTIYTRKELKQIADACHRNGLYLYLDGARLGNALTAEGNDLTLKEIARLTDIFYIGGTKNGALLGEAMVIRNDELKPNFRYLIKQRNAMLAKGRILGVQFLRLFRNDLYLKNARNANVMAQALKYIFMQEGIRMYIDSPTNQIFPILKNDLLERIKTKYTVTEWGRYDDEHTIVRFVCSWATKKEDIQRFYSDLQRFLKQK